MTHLDRVMDGRVALVTGGGGGIGAAVCRSFAVQGATAVFVADVDAERVAGTLAQIEEAGGHGFGVVGDLTTADGMATLTAAVAEEVPRIDVLVNALGEHLASAGPFEDSTEDEWQALYEVNLLHVFRACRAFVPGMKEQGWGRIVNFSSVEGIRSAPALAVYTAFKRAVDGFTKSLAVDLARDGILVNALAVDKTRSFQVGQYELPPEYERLVPTFVPAGRYGEPDDIARAVLFLGSGLNTWIVGQTIVADGGTLSAGGWFRTPKRWTNQPLLVQYFEDPADNDRRPPMLQ